MLSEAREFFAKMDGDLDNGYQMGRYWVENPNPEERCQIAADRLVTAIENENKKEVCKTHYTLMAMRISQ